jgi:succinyl-CoA synthetase alpha subunit
VSILVDSASRVVVQGITGAYARDQTKVMAAGGTAVVAGVVPGRGGIDVDGIPVYDSVADAVDRHDADTSVVYTSAPRVLDAVWEALDAGIRVVVAAAENVPLHDAMTLRRLAAERDAWIVGPNTVGLVTPGEALVGSIPLEYALPGRVGVASRSGSLAIEVVRDLSAHGIGQSTAVAVGGDTVPGRNLADYLRAFDDDPGTDVVVLLGEVGGTQEHAAAEVIRGMRTPVVAFVVGHAAPPNKRMGHVGAIVLGERDSARAKTEALRAAGATTVSTPWEIADAVGEMLNR